MKIHHKNHVIWLASGEGLKENITDSGVIEFEDADTLKKFLKQPAARDLIIWSNDIDKLKKSFLENFEEVTAAGGVVINSRKEVLLIFRKEKWDLPKGKVEEDESLEEGGLREVREEIGIGDLEISGKLPSTYHTYEENGRNILKTVNWFLMKGDKDANLRPEIAEDITKVCWINIRDLEEYMKDTYASIRETVTNAMNEISEG